jgi:surfactin synthase thioesterase subunit
MGMFFDRPFGFFGHSLGSLLVYEVALELRRRALPTPIFLAVSANTAPQMHTPDEVGEVGEGLSATDFVDKVRARLTVLLGCLDLLTFPGPRGSIDDRSLD